MDEQGLLTSHPHLRSYKQLMVAVGKTPISLQGYSPGWAFYVPVGGLCGFKRTYMALGWKSGAVRIRMSWRDGVSGGFY